MMDAHIVRFALIGSIAVGGLLLSSFILWLRENGINPFDGLAGLARRPKFELLLALFFIGGFVQYGATKGSGGSDLQKTYTITVYPNGSGSTLSGEVFGEKDGKSATAKVTVVAGETLGNKIGVAERSGYEFLGWYTQRDAGGVVFDANGSCKKGGKYWDKNGCWKGTANLKVYAHWAPKTYTIRVYPNGSGASLKGEIFGSSDGKESTAKVVVVFGSSANNVIGVAERPGYEFLGWYTQRDAGGVVFYEDGSCKMGGKYWDKNGCWKGTADLKLYAHWAPKTYTIKVYPNGSGATLKGEIFGKSNGKSATAKVTVATGETLNNKIGTAVRSGYRFLGWYTQRSAGGVVFYDDGNFRAGKYWSSKGTWKGTANLELYAHWEKVAKSEAPAASVATVSAPVADSASAVQCLACFANGETRAVEAILASDGFTVAEIDGAVYCGYIADGAGELTGPGGTIWLVIVAEG